MAIRRDIQVDGAMVGITGRAPLRSLPPGGLLGRPLRIPEAKGIPLLGMLPLLRRDPLSFFANVRRVLGPVIKIRLAGTQRLYLVSDPLAAHFIQHTAAANFPKSHYHDAMKQVFGENTILANGATWRARRRAVQPPFSNGAHHCLLPLVDRTCARLEERIEGLSARRAPFDIAQLVMEEALQSSIQIALRTSDEEAAHIATDLGTMMVGAEQRLWSPFATPLWVPLPSNRRLTAATARFRARVENLIKAGSNDGQTSPVLTSLREAGLTLDEQIDEIGGLIAAGFETTALTVAWALYLLSGKPYWRQQVRREARAARSTRSDGTVDRDRPVARMVVQETLRLYPPVWIFSRQAQEDCQVEGERRFHLDAGSVVAISPWVIHRSETCWDNPLGFDPNRFLDGAPKGDQQYRYVPFAGGARRCLGERYAMELVTSVVSRIVDSWDIDLVPGHRVEPMAAITLRPRDGIWVTAKAA